MTNVIRSIPAANGGEAIGPMSMFEVKIPPHPTGFIVPNSMYLHFQYASNLANPTGTWAFAGQADPAVALGLTNYNDPSPASALFSQIEVEFPNGQKMSYNTFDIYSWAISCSHVLPREYVRNDLKELMHCHTTRTASNGNGPGANATIAMPLDLPIFCAKSAFPLCLLTNPLTLRFYTNELGRALHGTTNLLMSSYTLTNICVQYGELRTDLGWKNKFVEQIRRSPFSIPVSDRMFIGQASGIQSTRVNIGVNLSSLNAVLVANVQPFTTYAARKCAVIGGLVRWNVYTDNERVNQFEMDDIATCYAELQRALGSFFNPNFASNLSDVSSNVADQRRTTYCAGQFLLGMSTRTYGDQIYTLTGKPVRNLAIEMERTTYPDPNKFPRGFLVGGAIAHIWVLHDTLCLVDADGNVTLRR